MSIFRTHISFPFDSAFPRDEITITPHFFGDNAQGLANALKANLIAFSSIGTIPFKIKVYDAEKAPPSYPLATAEQVGSPTTSTAPREVALCLSYYSTYNRPSYRGRLYLPHHIIGGGAVGARPTTVQRDTALAFKNVLANGLPASHNWVVYSRKLQKSFGVSNAWVDDEWDTVRSRGLKGTARTLGTVPGP
jgi:hypothetical protein